MSIIINKAYTLVSKHFGNATEAIRWFNTYNEELCDKPVEMIRDGRERKLLKFIETRLVKGEMK